MRNHKLLEMIVFVASLIVMVFFIALSFNAGSKKKLYSTRAEYIVFPTPTSSGHAGPVPTSSGHAGPVPTSSGHGKPARTPTPAERPVSTRPPEPPPDR